MIIGLGSDMVDVRRIARVIERHGERFLGRIFTATERAKADRRANRVETYAKRFAAKEACAKALGTGFRAGVFWRDLGVVNTDVRAPDDAADRRRPKTLAGGHARRLRSQNRRYTHRRGSDRAGRCRNLRRTGRVFHEAAGKLNSSIVYVRSALVLIARRGGRSYKGAGSASSGTRGK